jgi:hypothetical protein
VLVGGEQDHESFSLSVGEEVRAGVQGPAGPEQRVTSPSAVSQAFLLDALSAPFEGVAGQADHVEGVIPTSG